MPCVWLKSLCFTVFLHLPNDENSFVERCLFIYLFFSFWASIFTATLTIIKQFWASIFFFFFLISFGRAFLSLWFFFFWFVGFCLGYWRFRSVLCFCCCCCCYCFRYSWRGRQKARERKKSLFYLTRSEQLLPQTGELLFIRFEISPNWGVCCRVFLAVFLYIIGFSTERRAYCECSKGAEGNFLLDL